MNIVIGVSSCLMGQKVSDGGQRHDPYITDTLGRYFKLVPVCPEVASGMPIRREAMRPEGKPDRPRLVTGKSRIDRPRQMPDFCRNRITKLEQENLCGFIFRKDAPGAGLHGRKVYHDGRRVKSGRGLFAAEVVRHYPFLPVEEETRLSDPVHKDNFIERVFTRARWKKFLTAEPDGGKLMEFHSSHKLLVMAHSPTIYQELDALVAKGSKLDKMELFERYEELLMMAMAVRATVKKHTNVLLHVMGHLEGGLSRDENEELLALIRKYRDHEVPQIVPVAMLRHYSLKFNESRLCDQLYLSPHPTEVALKDQVRPAES